MGDGGIRCVKTFFGTRINTLSTTDEKAPSASGNPIITERDKESPVVAATQH